MLNERYDECVETLADEHAAFESTFLNVEADGSTWIYHLSLVGEGGRGHDPETFSVDEAHDDYGCRVKMRGWEELRPMFMVTPDHVRTQLEQWGRTGNV